MEAENYPSSDRAFVFILYLNDVEEGGETGFLFKDELRLVFSGLEFTYFAQWLETIAELEQEAIIKSKKIYTTWVSFIIEI